jgi:acetate kinase
MEAIAVLNAGSSSLKYSVFVDDGGRDSDGDGDSLRLLLRGQAEALFTTPRFVAKDPNGAVLDERSWPEGTSLGHAGALDCLVEFVGANFSNLRLGAVGHRVVHGGRNFALPTRIDASVVEALKALVPLAPLHQPHNLAPIEALMERRPDLPQVACFDTAFHRGQPLVAQSFALPRAFTERGVLRCGVHGL